MTTPDTLYDSLFAAESRFRKGGAYPIHKKLRFAATDLHDIYDWIIAHAKIPQAGEIVDAGCGVGFGTLRLAASSNANVLGISLSNAEISRAQSNARNTEFADRTDFRCQSFDDLHADSADLVVAVESVKHSLDLNRSLGCLVSALRPGGQLVIVEDIYKGPQEHSSARRMARDWGLVKVYSEADYLEVLPRDALRIEDLSDCMKTSSTFITRTNLGVLGVVHALAPASTKPALAAFRGGLHLQLLYLQGLMRYQALVFSKASGGS